MVIPHRDWLLLRGRMRAVAKISALPVPVRWNDLPEQDEADHAGADGDRGRRAPSQTAAA